MNNNNPTADGKIIAVQQVLDDNPLSFFQYLTIILGFIIVLYVGYAAAVMGFIGPALAESLNVTPSDLNSTMVASMVGLAIGSFAAGPFADKLGRKMVLLISVAIFGAFSVLASMMSSISGLTVMRLIVGLGLGAAMPISITLVSEYTPIKVRSLIVAVMFCGYTAGSALVGFVAAALLPHYGWQGVLAFGGWVSLVTIIVLALFLPESAKYLAEKHKHPEKIRAYLNKIGHVDEGVQFVGEKSSLNAAAAPASAQQSAIAKLFNKELGVGTAMLWVIFFMTMAYIAVYTSWLPTLFGLLGYEQSQAATLATLFQIGGTVGALIIGGLMDRVNPYKALGIALGIGSLITLAVAMFNTNFAWLIASFLIIGVTISGGMVGFNALAAAFYPTSARATGVSWALGIGRFGSISGSLLGGYLLGHNMGFGGIMTWMTVPVAIATIFILYMGVRYHRAK